MRKELAVNLDLNEIRQEIDSVDASIVELFEKRMNLCKNVALYKIENGRNVLDKQREIEKIEIGRASCRERV